MKPSRTTVAATTPSPSPASCGNGDGVSAAAAAAGSGSTVGFVSASASVSESSALPPFAVDRESALPLHRQIEHWLRARIEDGDLAPGAMLPARKELCELFGGINHLTIRKAVASLQNEGLLFSVQGSGTFVADKKLKPLRIAIVLPHLDDELTREISNGIQEIFDEEMPGKARFPEVSSIILDSRRDLQKELKNISQLEDLPLDGAIILPVSFGDIVDRLVRLKADRFPAVLLARIPELRFNTVCSDDYAGGYAITRHVLEKTGRRRLAWIGNREGHFSDVQRYDGYRDALNDHGIACDRKLVRDLKVASPVAPFDAALREALDSLLPGNIPPASRPDAIVCTNDLVALACIEELATRGIAVPGDIAVTGFDDIDAAARATPALTTVRNPMRELGHSAARLMLESIQNPDAAPQNITVPISVVVRASA